LYPALYPAHKPFFGYIQGIIPKRKHLFNASILRGKKYLLEKQSHGGAREKASAENLHLKTRDKIAKETGVSHATVFLKLLLLCLLM